MTEEGMKDEFSSAFASHFDGIYSVYGSFVVGVGPRFAVRHFRGQLGWPRGGGF
jgi:hypothetical protein